MTQLVILPKDGGGSFDHFNAVEFEDFSLGIVVEGKKGLETVLVFVDRKLLRHLPTATSMGPI